MSEILVVQGRTDLENFFANKIILGELKKQVPEAKFDILSEFYKMM
jgi:general stress protein 14